MSKIVTFSSILYGLVNHLESDAMRKIRNRELFLILDFPSFIRLVMFENKMVNLQKCHDLKLSVLPVVYRAVQYKTMALGKIKNTESLKMEFKENKKIFDPKKVYKDEPNPTKL